MSNAVKPDNVVFVMDASIGQVSINVALGSSVADPDPSDPYIFGPPGSGSFYHQSKIVRKTLIPTVL